MRKVDGFFYGLFMDPEVLRKVGVVAENNRQASVQDYALRIGNRATLIESPGAVAYGMVYSLTHEDLDKLYGAQGLEQYRPEAMLVRTFAGTAIPALCYNLIDAPAPGERNEGYAKELRKVLAELGFPADYVSSVA